MNKQPTSISFNIENLGNDAFVENPGFEIARILRAVSMRVMLCTESELLELASQSIRDVNGNTVGEIRVDWEASIDAMGIENLTTLVEQNLPHWKEAAELRSLNAKAACAPNWSAKAQLFMVFACDSRGHAWSFDIQSFEGGCPLRSNSNFPYQTNFILDGINDTEDFVVQKILSIINEKLNDKES